MKERFDKKLGKSNTSLSIRNRLNDYWQYQVEKIANRIGLSVEVTRESGWSFFLRALNSGLSFATTVLLARLLGSDGYGIYAFAFALAWLLAMPAQLGLPNLIIRETANGMARNRPDIVKGVWQWSGRLVGIVSMGLILLVGPLLITWKGGLGDPSGLTILCSLFFVPLVALGNLRGASLRGLRKIILGQFPEFVIRPGLFVLFLLAFGLFAQNQLSAPRGMFLNVMAALISFLIGAWMLRRNTPESVRNAKANTEASGWLLSSFLFALIAGFLIINKQISTIILGLFENPDQVGIYIIAVQLATFASFALQALYLVVGPRIADFYSLGEINQLQRLATGSARIVFTINLGITCIFVVIGKPFFAFVYGSEFIGSYIPLLILLIGQMMNSLVGVVGLLLNMTGYENITARIMAVAAGCNIVLNLLLIPTLGVNGAALATSLSMIVWNGMLWRAVRKHLGINSLAFNILPIVPRPK